jgi:hypothetical protein
MLTLAHLDRNELLALIQHAGVYNDPGAFKAGWRAVLDARMAQAQAAYDNAYAAWAPLSNRARADAESARTMIEFRGRDPIAMSKFAESRASVRAAADAWEKVRAAELACQKIAAQLRLVGKL